MGNQSSLESIVLPPQMQYHAWRRMCTSCSSRYVTSKLMLRNSKRLEEMEGISTETKNKEINVIIPKNIRASIEEMKRDLTKKYPGPSWDVDLNLFIDTMTEREYGILYGYTYMCDCCMGEFSRKHFSSEITWNRLTHGEYIWETPVHNFHNYEN